MTGRPGIAVLVVAVALAGSAAAPRAQPSDDVQAKATELVNDGIKLQSKRDFDGAVGKYKAAYCLIPEPALIYNIGTAYQEASRGGEAGKFFRLYLKTAPSGDLAGDAKAAIKSLKDKGSSLGVIECEKDKVKPKPMPVCADGAEPVGGVCPPACEAPRVMRDGVCSEAIVDTGPTEGSTSGGSGRNKTLMYAGFGTAGAGAIALGLGIMYGIKAKDASDALSGHTSGAWTQELLDKQQEGKDAETKQIVFTTVGGVLVAGGAVMIVLGLRKHDTGAERAAHVVPWIDGDSAGFALTGSY
jgi:hypothetical protein